MKCEHCGRNDATFYYRSNVNGQISEVHLCESCAETLGYRTRISGGWDDLLFMLPRAVGAEGFFAMSPFTQTRQQLRVLPEEKKPLLSYEEQRELRLQREKNALQVALDEAIEKEDYEQAAKLRDELKRFEK